MTCYGVKQRMCVKQKTPHKKVEIKTETGTEIKHEEKRIKHISKEYFCVHKIISYLLIHTLGYYGDIKAHFHLFQYKGQ